MVTEFGPFPFGLNRDQENRAIFGGERPIRRDRGMRQAHARRGFAAFGLKKRDGHPIGHDIKHRHMNADAFAGDPALNQCLKYRGMGGGTGGDINNGHPNPRRFVRPSGDG